MATWFTADLHLGHSNIIDYCGRPFANVDAMSRALIDNWNQAIAEDDTIWVIGDRSGDQAPLRQTILETAWCVASIPLRRRPPWRLVASRFVHVGAAVPPTGEHDWNPSSGHIAP